MRIEVRTFDGEATDSLAGYAGRSFYTALRPFAGYVRRVSVSLGKEQVTESTAAGRCRATIELVDSRRLKVEGEGEQPYLVVSRVAADAEKAVQLAIELPADRCICGAEPVPDAFCPRPDVRIAA